MSASEEDIRALARSALVLTKQLHANVKWHMGEFNLWLDREHEIMCVEDDGKLYTDLGKSPTSSVASLVGFMFGASSPPSEFPPEPADVVREDGLLAERPGGFPFDPSFEPMWQSYFTTAFLDPLELADGRSEYDETVPGTYIENIVVEERNGRETWSFDVAPTAAYEARCSGCCDLLHTRSSLFREGEPLSGAACMNEQQLDDLPTKYRASLDRETAVLVALEQLDGAPGTGTFLDLRIFDVGPNPPAWAAKKLKRRRFKR